MPSSLVFFLKIENKNFVYLKFSEPRLITDKLQIKLDQLLPCEKYLVNVALAGPIGPGPLQRNPLILDTPYNENKPPRNVRANIDEIKHTMNITWEHNCPLTGQYPPSYMLTITELTLNKSKTVELKKKGNQLLWHTFDGIPKGAVYNISLSSRGKNAESSVLKIYAPPLPAPRQLKVYPEKNNTYVIYWHEVQYNDTPYVFETHISLSNEYYYNYLFIFSIIIYFSFDYELIIVQGLVLNDTIQPIVQKKTKLPPIFVTPDDLGGKLSIGRIYTLGVRIKTQQGFKSPIYEIEHIEIQLDAWFKTVLPTKTSIWLVTIPIMLVIALVAVVSYMVQRHRRLQNSFSRFANSHYDTKTGATRIGDAIDDDDHHGSRENINDLPRFEDDEPLVIA